MTKRERDTLTRKIAKIEERVAKKRDELRSLVGDMDGILESVNAADDSMEGVLYSLRNAREALDREVADKLSEYV
jgi:predicted  nucleic acid-binding Zn-ribbon protein